MKKLYTLILIFNIGVIAAYSQSIYIGLNSGYGTYDLSSIKHFQQQVLSYYSPLDIKSVEKFPDYYNYSFTLEYKTLRNYSWGLDLAYFSTGARNHLLDYSGEYKLDMLVNAYRIGVLYKKFYPLNNDLSLYYHIEGGLVYSNYDIDEKITINNVDSIHSNSINVSNTFFIQPTIGANYYLGLNFSIDANVGYQLDINSRFITKKDSYIYWSGFRFLVGINYNISSVLSKIIKKN